MCDPDNLISDSVFQQPGDTAGSSASNRHGRNASSRGGDDSSDDDLERLGYSTVGGDMYLKTKIADINIIVPVPSQRKRRLDNFIILVSTSFCLSSIIRVRVRHKQRPLAFNF
jgi:hypothetical protein